MTQPASGPTLGTWKSPWVPNEAKLARIAAKRGSNKEALVHEAVEGLVDYDEYFLREVEKGIAVADRGELIDHEEIGKLIRDRYPG